MNTWRLFEDGNGCHTQAVDEFNKNEGGPT